MIRRLMVLAGLVVIARRWLRKRQASSESATIGYADGSSICLEQSAPGFDQLRVIAVEAMRR